MKYHLIFYIAKKTSYSEKAVKRRLKTIGGEAHRIVSATTPALLGEEVGRGLRTCPLTVIIGGLSSVSDDNLATVLSRVFSNSSLSLNNMRRLRAESGADGYIIRYKNQILLALPDSPENIEELCSDELLSFISEKTAPAAEAPEENDPLEPKDIAPEDEYEPLDESLEQDDTEAPNEDEPQVTLPNQTPLPKDDTDTQPIEKSGKLRIKVIDL